MKKLLVALAFLEVMGLVAAGAIGLHPDSARRAGRVAMRAAAWLEDPALQASAHDFMASVDEAAEDLEGAEAHLRKALEIRTRAGIGWNEGQADTTARLEKLLDAGKGAR